MDQLDQGHDMNGWLVLLFAALAIAVSFAYLAGRIAGLGRGEQDRGDLAEKNTTLLDIVRQLEARVAAQHQRIVAMTAWETVPWPDGRTSPVPVRPEAQPSALFVAVEARIPSPRPRHWHGPDWACDGMCDPPPWESAHIGAARPRERRTSTAAFLNPQACGPGMVPGEIPVTGSDVARHETPGPRQIVPDGWWSAVEDEIWSARLWLATL